MRAGEAPRCPGAARAAILRTRYDTQAHFRVAGSTYKGLAFLCLLVCAACGPEGGDAVRRDHLDSRPLHTAAATAMWKPSRNTWKAAFPPTCATRTATPALHRAARDGRLTIAQILLERRANANAVTGTGWSPMHLAIRNKQASIVELLLRFNADPNLPNPDGATPLHAAAHADNEQIVRYLLTEWQGWETRERELEDGNIEYYIVNTEMRKADINAKDGKGNTALHLAPVGRQLHDGHDPHRVRAGP